MIEDDPFAVRPDDGRTVLKPMPGGSRLGLSPTPPTPPPSPPPAPTADPLAPGAPPQAGAGPSAPAPVLDRAGVNPLETAAGPLLALASRLRRAHAHPDPAGLRNQMIGEVRAFEARARASGVKPETVLSARYVLCTVLDEAVLNTPWGNASVWRGHSLLSTFHNDTRGGEKFFVLLKEAAQDPAANRDLLELMYVCLALGFQGRYLVIDRGAEQLEELRARLFQILRTQRGELERDLSPHWQGIVDRRNPLMRFVPLWVVAAVAAVLLLALYVVLSFSLNAASDPVFAQLHGLKVSRQAAVVRPPEPAAAPVVVAPAPPKRPLRLRELLAPEIQQQLVDLKESPDRVTVIVRGDSLFRSGSAELAPAYFGLFQRIGEALDEVPGKVVVTGHTDNVPIRSVRFPSNWHLSQERALAVQKVVAERVQAKGRLTAEGRADTEPLAPNDSPANRARNRRVEVMLLSGGGGG